MFYDNKVSIFLLNKLANKIKIYGERKQVRYRSFRYKKIKVHDVYAANTIRFGDAADDFSERTIDLNEQLIRNKAATFFFRMNSDAMVGAGIFNGDTLIVDRSITNANNKVVIAILNGEMMVRRLEKTFNKVRLIAETENLSNIDVDLSSAEFAVWGVVVYSIHGV